MMARPGKISAHGDELMNWKPSWSMPPQLGVGGSSPTPRKLNPASASRAKPEGQRELNDDGRGHVGQDVPTDQTFRGRPQAPSGFDVCLLADGDHLASQQTHETWDEHDGDGDGRVIDVGAQQGGHGERQDEGGK